MPELECKLVEVPLRRGMGSISDLFESAVGRHDGGIYLISLHKRLMVLASDVRRAKKKLLNYLPGAEILRHKSDENYHAFIVSAGDVDAGCLLDYMFDFAIIHVPGEASDEYLESLLINSLLHGGLSGVHESVLNYSGDFGRLWRNGENVFQVYTRG